jgi:rhodanese-related sulfurtransferase
MGRGAALIDIRSESEIARDGSVAGALVIGRNVLEWRLDPTSQHRHSGAPGLHDQVIVMCSEGYQSSLVAATLKQLGFERATDLVGGFQAWRAAGLPIEPSTASAPAAAADPSIARDPAAGSQSSVSISQNASPANSR